MGSDDHSSGDIEWLGVEDGAEVLDTAPPRRHRWPRWTPLALLLVAGIVVAVVVTQDDSGAPVAAASSVSSERPAPSTRVPTPVIPSFTTAATPVIPTLGPSPPARPSVVAVGHPILGITAHYDLFARGPLAVVRIQFAAGRITTTGLPPAQSGAPVSFDVGEHAVIVRPLDATSGYLIPDGGAPEELTGLLASGGRVLPGPDPAHLWVSLLDAASGRSTVRLVDFHGTPTSTHISLPDGFLASGPDGAGYVLASGPGGVYDARPSGLTRITHGRVLAAGPSGWLARECDRHAHCTCVYVDRASGSRHRLPTDISGRTNATRGVIAPDGSTAALLETGGGLQRVRLIDLSSGAQRTQSWPMASTPSYQHQLAWSPDSRWLFVATDRLRALDTHAHRVRVLDDVTEGLALAQVAIRSATMEP